MSEIHEDKFFASEKKKLNKCFLYEKDIFISNCNCIFLLQDSQPFLGFRGDFFCKFKVNKHFDAVVLEQNIKG